MNIVQIVRRDTDHPLTGPEAEAVGALVSTAADHDGGPALSEQFRLALRPGASGGVTHLLADAAEGPLAGYAQIRDGSADEPPSAELVVAPRSRREPVSERRCSGPFPRGARGLEPSQRVRR